LLNGHSFIVTHTHTRWVTLALLNLPRPPKRRRGIMGWFR